MLSRQHYKLIADAIAQMRPEADEAIVDRVVDRLCEAFAKDNPKFNRKRFEKACERADS